MGLNEVTLLFSDQYEDYSFFFYEGNGTPSGIDESKYNNEIHLTNQKVVYVLNMVNRDKKAN